MRVLAVLLVAIVASATPALGQPPAPVPQVPAPALPAQAAADQALPLPATICGLTVPEPSSLPPAGSPPVLSTVLLCFEKQGGASVIEANTYLYYMELKSHVSSPRESRWVPYDDSIDQIVLGDFKRLWATNFLDDLAIEVQDVRFANGVIGKVVVYRMEERQRIKIVDYVGSKKVTQSDIEEELKKKGITIRLDSFIDPGLIRRVAGIVRDMYAEKGYQFAEIKSEVKEVSGGPKLVHLSFVINEGPKVKIRTIDFVGNHAVGDGKLRRKMKENKAGGFLGFLGGGTYKEAKFEEDADKVVEYYRDKGYITARVGQPDLKIIEDSKDRKTRWVEMQIPVTEGRKYKVGTFTFAGNEIVKSETLRPLFKLKTGDTYSEKKIRKGLDKARELYGTGGYFEFVGSPELKPRDMPASPEEGDGAAGSPAPAAAKVDAANQPPVVDVTMRMIEGKQYFVNRITFLGNTTTRDNVIRREMRLVESGVFNTEALKYSIRRLNQLGYFKNLEGDAIGVEKTPGVDNKVDVQLKFEEQNRNQLTFGAGVSQFEGFFGQLSFQTSNFLGRGETFTVSAQQGSRAKNYQVAFTEPFLFDRPMTVGVDLFTRELQYIGLYTQTSTGGNTVYGFRVSDFGRMFVNYSYERSKVKDLNTAFFDPATLQRNPFLRDSLQLGLGGIRTISKIGPSYVFDTVDSPIFPTTGRRFTASFDLAGLGGNTYFMNPRIEGIWYWQQTRRTSLGLRGQFEYITPYGSTTELPIFERLYLGGEYSIRGFDIRSIGPRDAGTGLVLGGNKSILFNAEYLISIAGPVRLVLFADAGQVRDRGQNFGWKETLSTSMTRNVLAGDFLTGDLIDNPFVSQLPVEVFTQNVNAFKTSIGAEVRFFMPVLNVPFRLIFAMNPSRAGVLDNNFQPEKRFKFRFAVGSTF